MQPVAAFAAEDLDREVERQVVRVPARQADVADADLGLDRAGPIDDDDAPRRRWRIRRRGGGVSTRAPVAERPLGAGKRLFVVDVADDREDRVVGAEVRLVERHEVVARDAGDRLSGVPESGRPYGWNP